MSVSQPRVFERNNYFYGKLLTTRDFKDEQSYFNQKRYLLNRLIHGNGIVWGLKVEAIDNHVIRVESGVALDVVGREVVVGKTVQPDIRNLNVFPPEAAGSKVLYLILEYLECPKEPMPAIVNSSSCKEVCESNRIEEGYKLALTNVAPPAGVVIGPERHKSTTLVHTDKMDLVRIVPKWVEEEKAFEVLLQLSVLETIVPDETIVIQVEEELPAGFAYLFKDSLEFSLTDVPSGTVIERSYIVRAGNGLGVSTIGGKTIVTVGGVNEDHVSPGSDVTVIEEETVYKQIVEQFFADQKEDEWVGPERSYVYLAELTLNDDGSIQAVSDTGRSYVYSNPLLAKLIGQGDVAAGKLLHHGLSHESGGSDAINVTNLSGVLAEPQKVTVIDGNGVAINASAIQFVGNSVIVNEDNEVAVVTIMDAGEEPIPGPDPAPPIVTGRVFFTKVKTEETRISPDIKLPIQEPCAINLAIEYSSESDGTMLGVMGHLADTDVHLSAIYDLKNFSFKILFQDSRQGNHDSELTYTVRYWIIPPTKNEDDLFDQPDQLWYREYVLSQLILYRGRTSDLLLIDPILNPVGRDKLEELLENLVQEQLVKKDDHDVFTVV